MSVSSKTSTSFRPAFILLAAGQSTRFGDIKQIAKVSSNQTLLPMLELQQGKLSHFDWPILIATGQNHEQLKQLNIDSRLLHFCDQAHLGMGHSISQISEKAYRLYQPSHLIIVLADQVALTQEDLTKLIYASQIAPEQIITSKTRSGLTAPSIFPIRFLADLMALTGDKGAKSIIKKYINDTQVVQIDNAQIDIDTKEDLLTWNWNTQTGGQA